MFCFNCGTRLVEGAVFCQNCGADCSISLKGNLSGVRKPEEALTGNNPVQDYPPKVPDFISTPKPITEFSPQSAPDFEVNPPTEQEPFQASSEINIPFPEIPSDSFTNTVKPESFDAVENAESASFRRDPVNTGERSFMFAETEPPIVNNSETPENTAKSEAESKNKIAVKKEKVYFGKAAFIFCLLIIMILSVFCGVFAGLYIKTSQNKTRAGAFTGTAGIIREYGGFGG